MCGIIGIISNKALDMSIDKFAHNSVLVGSVRGEDSVGMYQVDASKKLFYAKQAAAAGDFIDTKFAKGILNDVSRCPLTVIHHRAATNGKVSDDNAHPFIIHPSSGVTLAGVHNGSLTSWKRLDPDFKDQTFEVDSHWALSKISKEGEDFLNEIQGPFVFSWWDSRNPNVNYLARGTGRPMHFALVARTQNSKTVSNILYASEAGMLSWLAERNKIEVINNEIFEVPENTLIKFDLCDIGSYETKKIVQRTVVSTIPPSYSVYPSTHGHRTYGGRGAWDDYEDYYGGTQYSNSRTPSRGTHHGPASVVSRLRALIDEVKSEKSPDKNNVVSIQESNSSNGKKKSKNKKPRLRLRSDNKDDPAVRLGLKGKSMTFFALSIEGDSSSVVRGEALDEKGLASFPAVITGLDEGTANALILADWAECKVKFGLNTVGQKTNDGGEDVVLYLEPPTHIASRERAVQEQIERLLNGMSSTVNASETTTIN